MARITFAPQIAALLALACALAACAPLAAPLPLPAPVPLTGRVWLARDPAALARGAPPPPPVLPDAPPASPDRGLVEAWREPASRWMEAGLAAVAAESLSPLHSARALMLLAVAMNDGLVVAAAAREAGLAVSDRAVVAEAAGRILAASHPLLQPLTAEEREAAIWAGVWRGDEGVAAVLTGRQLGAAVADEVLAWAAADGAADGRPPLALPAPGPGVWAPTPPDYAWPQEPAWGRVRTVVVGDPASVRPAPPPPWGGPAMGAQIAAFVEAQAALTPGQRASAKRWAGGPGTVTPPGMWVELAGEIVARRGLALAEAAALYAALGVALHDTAVAVWDAKYHYMVARPVQVMEGRDLAWAPLLRTPAHPSYPSGHAAFSGAAAGVLSAAFPGEADALARLAQDAARSRVYGGIHWPMDGDAGLAQGAAVAALVIRSAGRR